MKYSRERESTAKTRRAYAGPRRKSRRTCNPRGIEGRQTGSHTSVTDKERAFTKRTGPC